MSDTKTGDDNTLSVTPKKTLTLKRPGVEQSTVRQNFSHGRTKSVVVETKRKFVKPGEKPEPVAVFTPRPTPVAAAPAPVAPVAAPAPAPAPASPFGGAPAAEAPAAPAAPAAPQGAPVSNIDSPVGAPVPNGNSFSGAPAEDDRGRRGLFGR